MIVSETTIDGDPGRYEQRYGIRVGSGTMHMVRRSAAIAPREGTIASVDDGPRLGVAPRISVGIFKGGEWTGVKFEPTHWVEIDEESHEARS